MELQTFGTVDKTVGCDGPLHSSLNGFDKICCARCFHIRMCIYKQSVYISQNIDIDMMILEQYKFIMKYCIISCKDIMLIFPKLQFKAMTSIIECAMMEQFKFRNSIKIADSDIDINQLVHNDSLLSVVMSTPNTKVYKQFKEDQGVVIKNNRIKFIDVEFAFDSGKYMYILNYYQTMKCLKKLNQTKDLDTEADIDLDGFLNMF